MALGVEDAADFVENIRAIELFALTGGTGDLTTMNPTGTAFLIGRVGHSAFAGFAWT